MTSSNFVAAIQCRNLFKQQSSGPCLGSVARCPKQRLNFRFNVVGLVQMVYVVKLTDMYLVHLRKPPFWLLFEAILINHLDHTKFREVDDVVVSIIRTYNVRERKFFIGDCGIDFIDNDMRLLFGL